jgi:hypothetical protein
MSQTAAGQDGYTANPLPRWELPRNFRLDRAPHRAGFLQWVTRVSLALAYLTMAPCFLGVPAVVAAPLGLGGRSAALHDLDRMRAGLMDPSGAAATERAAYRGFDGFVISVAALLFWGWFVIIIAL